MAAKIGRDKARLRLAAAARFLALSAVAACATAAVAAERPSGRVPAAESRVVSIGGAVTEIVYLLGADARLVAVDSTSRYPPQAANVPNVGYMRQLSAEPILALEPTLVLAVADAGPPVVLDQLRDAGVRLVTVPDRPSPEGVLEKISVVARALGIGDEGKAEAARIEREFARLGAQLAPVDRGRPSVLFLLSVGTGAPLAAGRETSAAAIIRLAGGRNAIRAFEGFKPVAAEAIVAAGPEVLLVTERTLVGLGGRGALLARPEIASTPAGRRGRVIAMDGLLLLGFGPRTPEAIRRLSGALHPAQPPTSPSGR